jgi:hypothetical protein
MKELSLENEWSLLQNQFDSYEKYSLLIKLTSIGLLSAAYFLNSMSTFVIFLLLVLWVQDAIWKTFQSRIESRLLQLEDFLSGDRKLDGEFDKAYQFNSQYQKNRHRGIALIGEYFGQAIRPTIAFPHVLLLLMLGFELLF